MLGREHQAPDVRHHTVHNRDLVVVVAPVITLRTLGQIRGHDMGREHLANLFLTYQERMAGAQAAPLYAFSILVIFLCLAALYESWPVPISILLALPLGAIPADDDQGIQPLFLDGGDDLIGYIFDDFPAIPDELASKRVAAVGGPQGIVGLADLGHGAFLGWRRVGEAQAARQRPEADDTARVYGQIPDGCSHFAPNEA